MTELVTQHASGGYILEELHVGMTAEKIIPVTEQRIQQFAEASDDFNPVHMDEAFASKTAYRGRIAHGLLSASFGSAVVGTILPGAGAIYISQTLQFHAPVRIGDDVVVRISVVSVDPESARVELDCEGFVDGKLIMAGVATVRVPRRSKPARDCGPGRWSKSSPTGATCPTGSAVPPSPSAPLTASIAAIRR